MNDVLNDLTAVYAADDNIHGKAGKYLCFHLEA